MRHGLRWYWKFLQEANFEPPEKGGSRVLEVVLRNVLRQRMASLAVRFLRAQPIEARMY